MLKSVFSILFGLMLLAGKVSLAQETLKLRILDKVQNTPVAYAIVAAGSHVHNYSDTMGYTRIIILDSQDVVSVRRMGYQTYSIPVKELPASGIIYLTQQDVDLGEVDVNAQNNQFIRVPYIKRSGTHLQSSDLPYNSEQCTFVPLPANGSKKIVRIRLKMEKGEMENPVTLHIYSANEQGLPDRELLDSNVIIYNKDIHKGEYTLFIASRNIRVTGDKVFIGLEWPGLKADLKEKYSKVGPRVKCAESIKEPRTYVRNAQQPAWQPGPVFEKHPSNMLVSLDYTLY